MTERARHKAYMAGWTDGATLAARQTITDPEYISGYVDGWRSRSDASMTTSRRLGYVPDGLLDPCPEPEHEVTVRTSAEGRHLALVPAPAE